MSVPSLRVGIFSPTFNVYGGGEFVAYVIANTLAQNNYEVILFTGEKVSQAELRKFFGEPLHPAVKNVSKHSMVRPRGILDFYQTIRAADNPPDTLGKKPPR